MANDGVITDHFLARYRALLDAEDAAFDQLEHSFEEGDRERFDADLEDWQAAMCRKVAFLQKAGFDLGQPAVVLT